MIRIALCDDNIIFLKSIHKMVKKEISRYIDDFYIEEYNNGKLLLLHHKNDPFDVIFLDIDMPKVSGFDLAKKLHNISSCHIVFVTNHDELVYDSFYFQPLNFITKGDLSNLSIKIKEVIKQLLSLMKQNKKVLLYNTEMGRISVYLKDILYIESNKHYAVYHFCNNKQTVQIRKNISDLEIELQQYDFVRSHRKYLVNLRHVFNIDKNNNCVIFRQNFSVPMSRNYKSIVDEKLTEYLREQ